MGIHGWYHHWFLNSGLASGVRLKWLPQDKNGRQLPVSALLWDFNGVIHRTASQIYALTYGKDLETMQRKHPDDYEAYLKRVDYLNTKAGGYWQKGRGFFERFLRELEDEHFQLIAKEITKLIETINPQDLLILSIDGPAPWAKLKQQRSRRFLSGQLRKQRTEKNSKVEYPWKADYPWPLFDTNAITPCTEFMIRLDQFLRRWIKDNAAILPPKVIYYSHFIPGEGEHRIMDDLRCGLVEEHCSNPRGIRIIYGSDSDLAMLGLIAYNRKTKKSIERIYMARDSLTDIIDIDCYRQGIMRLMSTIESEQGRSPIKVSPSVRVNWWSDFVVIFFLVGNDFLPRPPSLDDLNWSIDKLVGIYQQNLSEYGHTLTLADRQLNWEGLTAYLDVLGQYESEMLNHLAQLWYTDNGRSRGGRANGGRDPRKLSSVLENSVESTRTTHSQGTKFRSRDHYSVNQPLYNRLWYQRIFYPYGAKLEPLREVDRSLVDKMALQYLQGLAWVNNYYQFGQTAINLDWFYGWEYPPMFVDIRDYLLNYGPVSGFQAIPGQLPPNGLEQLLSVLPPQSQDLLPRVVYHLMSSSSPLLDLYPQKFKCDLEGKSADWQAIPQLPPFQPSRVKAVVAKMTYNEKDRLKYDLDGRACIWAPNNPISPYLPGERKHNWLPKFPPRRFNRDYTNEGRRSTGHEGRRSTGYEGSGRGGRGRGGRGRGGRGRGGRGRGGFGGRSRGRRFHSGSRGRNGLINQTNGISGRGKRAIGRGSTPLTSTTPPDREKPTHQPQLLTPLRGGFNGPPRSLLISRVPTRRGKGQFAPGSVARLMAKNKETESNTAGSQSSKKN